MVSGPGLPLARRPPSWSRESARMMRRNLCSIASLPTRGNGARWAPLSNWS